MLQEAGGDWREPSEPRAVMLTGESQGSGCMGRCGGAILKPGVHSQWGLWSTEGCLGPGPTHRGPPRLQVASDSLFPIHSLPSFPSQSPP